MTTNEAFEALKTYMIENYGAKVAAGGREITKKCHICGDSRDPSSRHMYIGLKDGVLVYNCFKCGAKGLIDREFFRYLGCYDVGLISICTQNNASVAPHSSFSTTERFHKNSSPILTYRDAPETWKKVDYMKNRLQYDFSLEDLMRFKVVLNLYDYLRANSIVRLTRFKEACDQLDQFFIGFLSMDNEYINMRRLVPEGKLDKYIDTRYVNYNIYGIQDNSKKYYIIPNPINTLYPVNIYIAEGVFDILGVYLNTDCDKTNAIFSSIGGKSYMALTKFFILQYGLINFTLHIYVDNDVDDYEIYKIKELLRPYGNQIYMHRNTHPGEKDYGVPRDKIRDTIVRV